MEAQGVVLLHRLPAFVLRGTCCDSRSGVDFGETHEVRKGAGEGRKWTTLHALGHSPC